MDTNRRQSVTYHVATWIGFFAKILSNESNLRTGERFDIFRGKLETLHLENNKMLFLAVLGQTSFEKVWEWKSKKKIYTSALIIRTQNTIKSTFYSIHLPQYS